MELFIERFEGDTLPPMTVLAKHFGVSVTTIASAVRALRSQGILRFSRGTPMRISARLLSSPVARTSSVSKLCRILRQRLESGDLPQGTALPKVAETVREYHVSQHTVQTALRTLEAESLIYRENRRFMAGMRPSSRMIHHKRAILLLIKTTSAWRAMHFSERYLHFCQSVTAGLDARGFQLTAVLPQVRRPASYEAFASGPLQVSQFVSRLGSRYAGALMVGSRMELGNVTQWADVFSREERPVVWFDTGQDTPDSSFSKRSSVTRCYCDDSDLVKTAIKTMAEYGHTAIAFLSRRTPDSWRLARKRQVVHFCEQYHIRLFVPEVPENEIGDDWEAAAKVAVLDLPQKSRASAERHLRYMRSYMPGTVSLLLKALSFPDCTALLAANDSDARFISTVLRMLEFEIPKRLSLLSIDNSPVQFPFSISSVAPNLSTLGMCAVRLLLGEHVADRENGELRAIPSVIDRGSIDYPSL